MEQGANDLHVVQLMSLPPQKNTDWFTVLVPAYSGCSGKKAVKQM